MELCLGMDDEPAESLWVRSSGKTNMGDTVTDVCYRPPELKKAVDDAFFRQLEEASCSQALVRMGGLNH